MVQKRVEYDEDSAICIECIEDQGLREIVKAEGSKVACCLCGKKRIAVSIKELATIVDPYIREHFAHGRSERRYGDGDDDGYWEEQLGDDLSYVVQEILGQSLDCEEELINALVESDPYDPRDGEDAFYDETVNYEAMPVSISHLYEEWNAISYELTTQRRFFSDHAREFFGWLFDSIEQLRVYATDTSNVAAFMERKTVGVVETWPVGMSVFRARRADTQDDYTHIICSPKCELAPPSSEHARAGRMNPEGVPVFYGALDEPTCLAEMRSSIGGYIIVGRFRTSRELRLLDFNKLDKASWDGKQLSYFDPDYSKHVARRRFRRSLHRLISQPIVPGRERDYLITQVLAEYLAHVREQNFDGLLFASTQREGGTNVVLFPKLDRADDRLAEFSLEYIEKSVGLYQTRKIEYDIPKVDFFLHGDKVHLYHDYDDDDDLFSVG